MQSNNRVIIKSKYNHKKPPKDLNPKLSSLIKQCLWYTLSENSKQQIDCNLDLTEKSFNLMYEYLLSLILNVKNYKIFSKVQDCELEVDSITNLNETFCYFFYDKDTFSLMEHFLRHVRNAFAHGAFNDEEWIVLCDYNLKGKLNFFLKYNNTKELIEKTDNSVKASNLYGDLLTIIQNPIIKLFKKKINKSIIILDETQNIFEYKIENESYFAQLLKINQIPKSVTTVNATKEFIKNMYDKHKEKYTKYNKYIYIIPFGWGNVKFSNVNDAESDSLIIYSQIVHSFLQNRLNPKIFGNDK